MGLKFFFRSIWQFFDLQIEIFWFFGLFFVHFSSKIAKYHQNTSFVILFETNSPQEKSLEVSRLACKKWPPMHFLSVRILEQNPYWGGGHFLQWGEGTQISKFFSRFLFVICGPVRKFCGFWSSDIDFRKGKSIFVSQNP